MDDELQKFASHVAQLFDNLVVATWNSSSPDVLYTLVRVSGMSGPGWDPFDESINAFADYKELIEWAEKEGNKTRLMRFMLLYYCHLIESSAPLELLFNLFRIRAGKPFHIRPFIELHRPKKKNSFKSIPPGVTKKIQELEKLASHAEDKELIQLYKSVYNDDIRNSFFHSDYCLTDSEYRWTESGPAQSMKLDALEQILDRAFVFFKAMFHVWDQARYQVAAAKRYWQLPNYETLELLRNPKGMLIGFNMHFSNGNKATFCRNLDGSVTTNNLTFEPDGSINFFVGLLTDLKPVWWIDGKAVLDWDEVNQMSP